VLVEASEVSSSHRNTMSVEKLKELDRNLAAVVEPIAETNDRDHAIGTCGDDVHHDIDQLGHGFTREEVILRNLVELAHPSE
jgi:hypothetical protein